MSRNLDISKPWKYKDKWLIWPNTVLEYFDLVDCNDTVNGVCLEGKSITECIDSCLDKDCGAGYHVRFNNGKTICVPLKITRSYVNPVYLLQHQSFYPGLNYVDISVFINTDIFPFPPNLANVVFYQDMINIIHGASSNRLSSETKEIDTDELIYISDKNTLNIQFISVKESDVKTLNDIPVKYGDYIIMTIPGTSLVVIESNEPDSSLKWSAQLGSFSDIDTTFQILPVDNTRKNGDMLAYGDKFAFGYSGYGIVVVDEQYNYLRIEYNNIPSDQDPRTVFTVESKMTGYYCNNGKCDIIPIKDVEKTNNNQGAVYKDNIVYRKKNCWNICSYSRDGKNIIFTERNIHRNRNVKVFFWFVSFIILIYVIYIAFSKSLKRTYLNKQ